MSYPTPTDRDLAVARRLRAGFTILVVAGGALFLAFDASLSVVGAVGGAVIGGVGAVADRWWFAENRDRLTRELVGVIAAGLGAAAVLIVLETGIVVPTGVVATGLLAAAIVHALTWAAM